MAGSRTSEHRSVGREGEPGVAYRLGRLVTAKQLAERLAVSIRTVRDWIYRRVVPFTKLGGRVYFSEDVVEGMLAANAVEARPSCSPRTSVKRKEERHARRIEHE